MDKKDITPKLANVMNAVPECEGLIYAKIANNEVVVGQTITEMDHGAIVKAAALIAKSDIGKPSNKGQLKDVSLELEKGFLIIVQKGEFMLIGILGIDGKNSVGLLTRQLKQII